MGDVQHEVPHTIRPSEQVTPALPPSVVPHVSEHVAVDAQVTTQFASHLMLQCAASWHEMVLESPRLILQIDESVQVAEELSPALRSQFAMAEQVIWLFAPPFPLHSDVSMQLSVKAPFVLPLHFAAVVQLSEHALSPQLVWQSVPAAQVHDVSAHVQPVPVHVGGTAELSSPQAPMAATTPTDIASTTTTSRVLGRIGSSSVPTCREIRVGRKPRRPTPCAPNLVSPSRTALPSKTAAHGRVPCDMTFMAEAATHGLSFSWSWSSRSVMRTRRP